MTIEELRALNSGSYARASQVAPVTLVENPEICERLPAPQPTGPFVGIDTSKLVNALCGYFDILVDASNTANPARVEWFLGGCSHSGESEIVRMLFNLPNIPFAVDTAGFLDGTCMSGAVLPSAGLTNFLNGCIFPGHNVIVGAIEFNDGGSTDSAFRLLKGTCAQVRSMRVAANFDNCTADIAADSCSRCFNSNDRVITWKVLAPISATEGVGFSIPVGTVGTFRFCVAADESVKNFTTC